MKCKHPEQIVAAAGKRLIIVTVAGGAMGNALRSMLSKKFR
jgi:hypothetical protein